MRVAVALMFALLAAPAAWADEPSAPTERDQVAAVGKAGENQTPHEIPKRRLTTTERWRGGPYLRSSENDALRAQALGRALPIEPARGSNAVALRASESDGLRRQALDMALPFRPGGF